MGLGASDGGASGAAVLRCYHDRNVTKVRAPYNKGNAYNGYGIAIAGPCCGSILTYRAGVYSNVRVVIKEGRDAKAGRSDVIILAGKKDVSRGFGRRIGEGIRSALTTYSVKAAAMIYCLVSGRAKRVVSAEDNTGPRHDFKTSMLSEVSTTTETSSGSGTGNNLRVVRARVISLLGN